MTRELTGSMCSRLLTHGSRLQYAARESIQNFDQKILENLHAHGPLKEQVSTNSGTSEELRRRPIVRLSVEEQVRGGEPCPIYLESTLAA